MNRLILLWIVLALTACAKSMTSDSVDALVNHPEKLKAVMHQCQEDPATMGDVECTHASEAFRRRFMGDGRGKYTPRN